MSIRDTSELGHAVVMTLDSTGPQHGWALAKRVLGRSHGLLDATQAMLYPALLRLEQQRWIRSEWDACDACSRTKYYRLTARGRRQIRESDTYDRGAGRVAAVPQSVAVMLAAAFLSPMPEDHTHVRSVEPRIAALIQVGARRSGTFRHLVAELDASDVIVYIESKQTRTSLGGYLVHGVTIGGGYRYLRVKVDLPGPDNRVIAVLAHELQHAVEVVRAPEAVDAPSLEKMFSRRAIGFGCDGSACYETQAARDVEHAVVQELTQARASGIVASAAKN